jgi:hypothetical protein
MKDELIKILPDLKQAMEQGVAYAGDLFNRAVMYYKVSTIIGLFVCFMVFFNSIYFYKNYKKLEKDNDDTDSDAILAIIFGILGIVSILISIFLCLDLVQLYTIPEIYILQVLTTSN